MATCIDARAPRYTYHLSCYKGEFIILQNCWIWFVLTIKKSFIMLQRQIHKIGKLLILACFNKQKKFFFQNFFWDCQTNGGGGDPLPLAGFG